MSAKKLWQEEDSSCGTSSKTVKEGHISRAKESKCQLPHYMHHVEGSLIDQIPHKDEGPWESWSAAEQKDWKYSMSLKNGTSYRQATLRLLSMQMFEKCIAVSSCLPFGMRWLVSPSYPLESGLQTAKSLLQEHYCIAVGINDGAGMLERFELPAYSQAKPLLPSRGLPNVD